MYAVKEEIALLAEVPLGYDSRTVLIHHHQEIWIQVDVQILSLFHHFVYALFVFPDLFVIVVMVVLLKECLDLELMEEFEVQNISAMSELYVYVYAVAFSESFVDDLEVIGVDSFDGLRQFLFVVTDEFGNSFGSADGSLLVFGLVMFVDPGCCGAVFAEELPAALAVIADVLEIELALAGLASLGFGGLQNDGFGLWFSR